MRDDMDVETFKEKLFIEMTTTYHGNWTLLAETRRGFAPAGLVLGIWPHAEEKFTPFMLITAMLWFPWATARNRIESAVNFFNRMRSEIPFVEMAAEQDVPFFNVIAQHGIMRRVGTSYNVYPGAKAAIFETIRR